MLKACVLHRGSNANEGHYITVAERHNCWFQLDDGRVYSLDEQAALTLINESKQGRGYRNFVVFYEKAGV